MTSLHGMRASTPLLPLLLLACAGPSRPSTPPPERSASAVEVLRDDWYVVEVEGASAGWSHVRVTRTSSPPGGARTVVENLLVLPEDVGRSNPAGPILHAWEETRESARGGVLTIRRQRVLPDEVRERWGERLEGGAWHDSSRGQVHDGQVFSSRSRLDSRIVEMAAGGSPARQERQFYDMQHGRFRRVELQVGAERSVAVAGGTIEATPVHVAAPDTPGYGWTTWVDPAGDIVAVETAYDARRRAISVRRPEAEVRALRNLPKFAPLAKLPSPTGPKRPG